MKFLIFILIFVGMFMISGSLLKLPPYSTSQRLRSISGKAGMTEMLKQRLLLPVIKIVALIVHFDDFKERRMQIKLERAGFIFTPQEYYARAVVMSAGTLIIGGIISLAIMPVNECCYMYIGGYSIFSFFR